MNTYLMMAFCFTTFWSIWGSALGSHLKLFDDAFSKWFVFVPFITALVVGAINFAVLIYSAFTD